MLPFKHTQEPTLPKKTADTEIQKNIFCLSVFAQVWYAVFTIEHTLQVCVLVMLSIYYC